MIKTSLFADQEREAKLNKLGDALQVMEQHVDFAALAAEVDLAAPRPSRERGGRPPFPTELMVRVLLIQQLFNLSDEQMVLTDRESRRWRLVGEREQSIQSGSSIDRGVGRRRCCEGSSADCQSTEHDHQAGEHFSSVQMLVEEHSPQQGRKEHAGLTQR